MLANLRLIRDVAHSHSISKGAKLCEISQSAASQAIQEIERELGVTLFDRSTRPLTVTTAGKLYVEYCRDVLRRYEQLEAGLHRLKKEASGKVRLAAIYSVGLSDMSEIEEHFHHLFPQAELCISYLRPERVWEAVETDQADLGLMSYAESSRDIIALPWRDEEMVVAVGPEHRLSACEYARAEDLEGENFIGFDDDLPIQSQIERFFREHRVSVEITLRFDNLEMIKQAVAHGAGVSIMPRRVMNGDLQAGRLRAIPLEPTELFRPVRIIHRRRKVLSEAMEGLLSLLQESEAQFGS
jgi:LysR family transcriptional regulator, transcriptional activator of the cysJI operon